MKKITKGSAEVILQKWSGIKYNLKDIKTFYNLAGRREKYIRIYLLTNYVNEKLEKTGKFCGGL